MSGAEVGYIERYVSADAVRLLGAAVFPGNVGNGVAFTWDGVLGSGVSGNICDGDGVFCVARVGELEGFNARLKAH